MSVSTIVARALIRQAIVSYRSHRQEKWRSDSEKEGIAYLASFFIASISDRQELRWIIDRKIIPMVERMSDAKLKQLLRVKNQNEKSIAKGRPTEKTPISSDMIIACHEEYLRILRAEAHARELKMKQEARAAAHEKAHRAFIYENGESDTEIAQKMF